MSIFRHALVSFLILAPCAGQVLDFIFDDPRVKWWLNRDPSLDWVFVCLEEQFRPSGISCSTSGDSFYTRCLLDSRKDEEFLHVGTCHVDTGDLGTGQITARTFYWNYLGHPGEHLIMLMDMITDDTDPSVRRPVIWIVGDSSADNKNWIKGARKAVPAVNGYEDILNPPDFAMPDFNYAFNSLMVDERQDYFVMNTGMEESTLYERRGTKPLVFEPELLVIDNIKESDILVVSVGANDIVLRPTVTTIFYAAVTFLLNTEVTLRENPRDAIGFQYFIDDIFHDWIIEYVQKLVAKGKPKLICLCGYYFPGDYEDPESWANDVLFLLGYSTNPAYLQEAIRQLYLEGISKIEQISGVPVIGVPFYEVMDGSDPSDYSLRVEPGIQGGQKMADIVWRRVQEYEANRPLVPTPKEDTPLRDSDYFMKTEFQNFMNIMSVFDVFTTLDDLYTNTADSVQPDP